MVELFNTVLQMSLNASVVTVFVLLARAFLTKAPKKYSYLLWSVVGFRLCCPVSFKAVFSVFGIGRPDAPELPSAGGDIVIDGGAGEGSPDITDTLQGVTGVAADGGWVDTFNTIVMIIWFIGATAVLLYSVVSYIKVRRMMSNAVRYDGNVYLSDSVGSPFTLGFFRPRIYLPFGLDDATREQIITHERCHIKRLDHIIKPLGFVILAVHWFNPVCWVVFRMMSLDMELSCDESVLTQKGDEAMKKNYSRALLSFAANRRFPAPSPIAFSESSVNAKRRIKNALGFKKSKLGINLVCIILCVIVLAACATDASTPRWRDVKTEVFGETPYNFVFVSNGDGTCYIKEIRVDKDHTGDIHLVIPELSPTGDSVTRIATCGFYNESSANVPLYITEDAMDALVGKILAADTKSTGYSSDRASNIVTAFYMLKISENGAKYFRLEPYLSYAEKERISAILTASGYDEESCYDDTVEFANEIADGDDSKDELLREAFKYLYYTAEHITEITFPESVTEIAYGSFRGCTALKKVSGLTADDTVWVMGENGEEAYHPASSDDTIAAFTAEQ